MQHNCCIVTNYRYADHIEKVAQKGDQPKGEIRNWLRTHCISFTFVRDEFMPVSIVIYFFSDEVVTFIIWFF